MLQKEWDLKHGCVQSRKALHSPGRVANSLSTLEEKVYSEASEGPWERELLGRKGGRKAVMDGRMKFLILKSNKVLGYL